MEKGMSKFSNEDILIYVKPIPEFFSGEHTPLLCWQGSGYEFEKIANNSVGDKNIYSGILKKDQDELHTAWWYTDGTTYTIDQYTWRSEMMKNGKRFCLINVTAKDEATLMANIRKLMSGQMVFAK
jgi:hypothetical protein